ncbi:MAG: tRNA pseudouridine(38-40) synthase TruA [Bacteroidota bacterium]|nr:tRNA pseudouridine(38-40) synthase TruA [Bacteroidota bacterium]
MQRYFLRLSFNGTNYHGWQIQENTPTTVQQVMNEMLSKLLNEPVLGTGCGRTDTGVHAHDFYLHFDSSKLLLEEKDKWIYRFNQALPSDIAITELHQVSGTANSRFDAIARTYEYHIHQKKDPFLTDRSYLFSYSLDLEAMNKAALFLFEYNDFTSFAKTNTQSFTNNCKIFKAEWKEESGKIIFTISADRFLRNMVRAIVGTLMDVGKGKISPEDFKKVIEGKSRSDAGFSVPACGLYLEKVDYPENYFNAGK